MIYIVWLNFCSFAEQDPGIATEETLTVYLYTYMHTYTYYRPIHCYVHTYVGIASSSIHKLINYIYKYA